MSDLYVPSTNGAESTIQALRRRRHAHIEAIEAYTGSDPLHLWYKYLCWLEEAICASGGDRVVIENALQLCIAALEDNLRYKQDRRMLKICINYVS